MKHPMSSILMIIGILCFACGLISVGSTWRKQPEKDQNVIATRYAIIVRGENAEPWLFMRQADDDYRPENCPIVVTAEPRIEKIEANKWQITFKPEIRKPSPFTQTVKHEVYIPPQDPAP